MYQFKIIELPDGGYRFELGAIRILVDNFSIIDDKHVIATPRKAIGYFNFDGSVYGISNDTMHLNSAEAFFDSMSRQYMVFANSGNRLDDRRQTA